MRRLPACAGKKRVDAGRRPAVSPSAATSVALAFYEVGTKMDCLRTLSWQ